MTAGQMVPEHEFLTVSVRAAAACAAMAAESKMANISDGRQRSRSTFGIAQSVKPVD